MIQLSDKLAIDAAATGKALFAIASALTLLHVLAMIGWYEDYLPVDDWLYISFFDLDEEESLGTWFSAVILLIAGALSLLQARFCKRAKQGWLGCWYLLGFGFCLLSLDEIAGFHEFVNTVVEDTHWTTFALVLLAVLGLAFIPFLRALPARTRWLFLLAGIIYAGGAVGIERATIWHEEHDQLDTLAYNLTTALEEFMEMSGVILYIHALLALLARQRQGEGLEIHFR